MVETFEAEGGNLIVRFRGHEIAVQVDRSEIAGNVYTGVHIASGDVASLILLRDAFNYMAEGTADGALSDLASLIANRCEAAMQDLEPWCQL